MVSGHVYRVEGKRRPVWRAKYRLPDGRQVKKTLGPAWTARGRPPAGYFTKRTAEAWLRVTLAKAAEGTLPGMVRTGATVADACAEYLRYIEQDRARKPSTLRDYDSIFRNHVLPHLGDVGLEDLTPDRVERWAASEIDPDRRMANRTREKTITVFHGVMERARKLHRLPANPVADVEKPRTATRHGDPGLLARGGHGARPSRGRRPGRRDLPHRRVHRHAPRRTDRAALAGRRLRRLGDPRAHELHERPPDLAEVRQGPLGPDGTEGRGDLARLGQRELFSDGDDLVFLGIIGGHLDGSALSKRYRAALARAGLRPLRFHDLRRTFGTRVIGVADIRRVQEWMGHANVQTTMQ